MISVNEAATLLDITPSRVRKLIADDLLIAEKIGNAWAIDEATVMQRIAERPKAGRPSQTLKAEVPNEQGERMESDRSQQAHALFLGCKELLQTIPNASLLASAQSKEEASFYIAVSDFFLQQRQRKLIEQGIF